MKNIRSAIALITLLCLSFSAFAQQYVPKQFNHGNNETYTPYHSFATPVAQPTPLDSPPPLTGTLSNLEKDIATKTINGANSGIHFPKGTKGLKTVRYDLYITDSTVNYTGKNRHGIAVNGSIPGPVLSFTVGDTALIYVHNLADEPTSIHWHGVQLPSRMDGVTYLTQLPIPPNTTYIYKFPVVQAGTYWYHSHFALQEQIGIFGSLIFNKRTEPDIPTIPVVLSDWSDIKPKQINRMLHTGNDWFAIKKHSVQSYWEAGKAGKLGVKFANEWKRMEAMDVSDVYYDRFFLNGDASQTFSRFEAGDKVRLRIVNGGASSYFWLTYSGGKIMVVANDGNDVVPVKVDRLIVSPSETYDVILTIPEDMTYEFLATAEDRSGSTSLWLGSGMKMPAKELPKLNYFEGMKMMNDMMKMNGDMKSMGMDMALQEMDMNEVMYPELDKSNTKMGMKDMDGMKGMENMNHAMHTDNSSDKITALNYNMLQATENTTLPEGQWKTLHFELTGNMNRYVWSINGATVSESDKIKIEQGENLRIVLHNNTMMRHPMHLHGHDFRLLNQFGKKSPLKNVVDIMPMETDTLEFRASESGDWFFHCHILYHMMSGMGRIFSYENSSKNPEIPNPNKAYRKLKNEERMFHLMFQNDFATNGNDGAASLQNTRWSLETGWRLGYNNKHGYEVETHLGRYIGKMQWFMPFIGFDWHYRKMGIDGHEKNLFGQINKKDNRAAVSLGFRYTLPLLINFQTEVYHDGLVRLQLMREDIPVSKRIRAGFMVNTDLEYMAEFKYIITKNMGIRTHYDSDMGFGVGLSLNY